MFIGHETIIPKSDDRGMAVWRESLFASMQRNTEHTGSSFCLPSDQLVEIGTEARI